ncbi:hypothetical protein Aduo_000857 [Ancylostoma duodenale]
MLESVLDKVSLVVTFITVPPSLCRKWIADCDISEASTSYSKTFFTNSDMLWIANNKSELDTLKHMIFEGRVIHNREARLVSGTSDTSAIITRKGAKAGISAGTVTLVSKDTSLSVLCSRDAEQLESYVPALVDRMGEAGLRSYSYSDSTGKNRGFLVFRNLHVFKMDEKFAAGPQYLHDSCKGFMHGYAASPFDFEKASMFSELLKKEDVNIVAVPGQKMSAHHVGNLDTCSKDPTYRHMRTQFKITLPTNETKVISESVYWRDTFPDRTCADTPRVALGFTQKGLVDIPAIARHGVVCTYGRPPSSSENELEKTCHHLAHYDKDKKQCACSKQEDDLTKTKIFLTTETDRSLSPGVACLDCDSDRTHDVFFFVDISHDDYKRYNPVIGNLFFSFATHNARARLILYGIADEIFQIRMDFNLDKDVWTVMDQINERHETEAKKSTTRTANLHKGLEKAFSGASEVSNSKIMAIIWLVNPAKDPAEALKWTQKYKEKGIPVHVFATSEGGKDPNIDKYGSEKAFIIDKPAEDTAPDVVKAATILDRMFVRSTCLQG